MLHQINPKELEIILADLEQMGLIKKVILDKTAHYKVTKKGLLLYKSMIEKKESTIH